MEMDLWQDVQDSIENEGFHYCFDSYSDWDKIQDQEFHRLRLQYLEAAKLLKEYINQKNQ